MSATQTYSDPYAQWLGIRASDRPLDPFQLLGLQPFDLNGSSIRAALKKRRDQLSYHRDTDPKQWTSMSHEVEEAARILLDPEERDILVASMRRQNGLSEALSCEPADSADTVTCNACQAESPGHRKYCPDCGGFLWDVCPECHTVGPASGKFCSGCGNNRVELSRAAADQAREAIANAEALRHDNAWIDAIRCAHGVACTEDFRLDEIAGQAAKLWREWKATYQQLRVDFAEREKEAVRCLEHRAEAEALSTLEQIPPALRSAAAHDIERRARSTITEVEHWESVLRASMHAKKIDDMGPAIEQLLRLRPEHAVAMKLATKVGHTLVSAARKRMDRGDFAGAAGMLRSVPRVARDDACDRLSEELEERIWLIDHLKTAVDIDDTLIRLAERLATLAPDVAAHQEWVGLLKRQPLAESRGTDVPWNRTRPGRSAVGPPIAPMTMDGLLKGARGATFRGEDPPSVFGIALGLAWQALGDVPIATNLIEERGSWLTGIGRSRAQASTAWGIDVGTATVKGVRLRRNEDGTVGIDASIQVAIDDARRSTVPDTAAVASAFRTFTDRAAFSKGERIAMALPSTCTLTKTVRMPPAKSKQLRDVIQHEAKQAFPLPLDELVWDHAMLSPTNTRDASNPTTVGPSVVFVAARKALVDTFVEAWASAGGPKLDILQDGPLAAHNFLRQVTKPRGLDSRFPALLDIGASRSTFLVAGPNDVWSRSLPFCGNTLTERISREFKLTFAQAELVKHEPWRAKSIHRVFRAIAPALNELKNDIRRTISAWEHQDRRFAIERLYLAGGGAQLHGLAQSLWFEGDDSLAS